MTIPTWCADMQLNDTDKVLGLFFIVGGMLANYMVNPQLIHHFMYGDEVAETIISEEHAETLGLTKAYVEWLECVREDHSTFANQCRWNDKLYIANVKRQKIKRPKYPNLLEPTLEKFDEQYAKFAKLCKNQQPLFGRDRRQRCRNQFLKYRERIDEVRKN